MYSRDHKSCHRYPRKIQRGDTTFGLDCTKPQAEHNATETHTLSTSVRGRE